jgi:hypothetical protein
MDAPTFIIALAIVGGTLVMVAKTIAGAITGRKGSRNVEELREQMDRQAAALEDAENALANQSAQIAELQERLDFTERVLTQGRERSALRPGEEGKV